MPIYEYACGECQPTLDALQKMSDDPLVECPACGKPALRKKVSAPRFRLKGEGWYETDFKKENQRNVHKSDSEPAKSKDTGKADKKDAKSEPKKDSGKTTAKPEAKSNTTD